jgi:hypothetical protein
MGHKTCGRKLYHSKFHNKEILFLSLLEMFNHEGFRLLNVQCDIVNDHHKLYRSFSINLN